jgi:hypothetical protein
MDGMMNSMAAEFNLHNDFPHKSMANSCHARGCVSAGALAQESNVGEILVPHAGKMCLA